MTARLSLNQLENDLPGRLKERALWGVQNPARLLSVGLACSSEGQIPPRSDPSIHAAMLCLLLTLWEGCSIALGIAGEVGFDAGVPELNAAAGWLE